MRELAHEICGVHKSNKVCDFEYIGVSLGDGYKGMKY